MIRTFTQRLTQQNLAAISTVFSVGSGGGSGLLALRQLGAERIVLTEAHPDLAKAMNGRIAADRREEIWPVAITSSNAQKTSLHVLNHWHYNSTKIPAGLGKYLPNVSVRRSIEVAAKSIVESITSLKLDSKAVNVLVLDAPGQAFDLAESATARLLQLFSWVIVRGSDEPLYEDEGTIDRIANLLTTGGFDAIAESPDAVFPESAVLFERNDAIVELQQLKSQLELAREAQVSVAAQSGLLEAELTKANETIARQTTQVVQLSSRVNRLQELQGQLTVSAERVSAMDAKLDNMAVELSDTISASTKFAQKQIDRAAKKVAASAKQVSALDARLVAMTAKIEDGLTAATKDIYRKVDRATINAAKQVEAYIGVHSYLATGELPSLSTEGHAWPVSPDFAQYLIELIEANNYDAIIEFGSGVSTVVIGKAVERKSTSFGKRMPTTITSFEHLEIYHAQTTGYLSRARIFGLVDLVLSPLQPYEVGGVSYLYYNCFDALCEVQKQISTENPRVLVVVDGPPGKTNRHARYPAMPIVLSIFESGQVDFLMDDYAREDEKEIIDIWKRELSSAGVEFHASVRKLEKDACLVEVRPKAPLN